MRSACRGDERRWGSSLARSVALERHPLAVEPLLRGDRSARRIPSSGADVALRKVAKRLGGSGGRLAETRRRTCAESIPRRRTRGVETQQRPELGRRAADDDAFSRRGTGTGAGAVRAVGRLVRAQARRRSTRRCYNEIDARFLFAIAENDDEEHTVAATSGGFRRPDPDAAHCVFARAAERFADATGLPRGITAERAYTGSHAFSSSVKPSEGDGDGDLRLRRDYGVLGVVVGHARDLRARLAAEAASEVATLRCIANENSAGAPRVRSESTICCGSRRSSRVRCVRAAPHALGAVLRDPAEARARGPDGRRGRDVGGAAPGSPLDMDRGSRVLRRWSRPVSTPKEGKEARDLKRGRRRYQPGKTYPSYIVAAACASATSSDARGTSHRPRTKAKSDDGEESSRARLRRVDYYSANGPRALRIRLEEREEGVRDGFRFVPVYPVRGVRVAHHLRAARRE